MKGRNGVIEVLEKYKGDKNLKKATKWGSFNV